MVGSGLRFLKYAWMSLGSSGLFAANKIEENLKLDRLPKPLPERLIFIARELFFGLDQISGFWSLQEDVLRHFLPLAQNHCQNRSFSLRASHFSVWTEYLVFGASRKPF